MVLFCSKVVPMEGSVFAGRFVTTARFVTKVTKSAAMPVRSVTKVTKSAAMPVRFVTNEVVTFFSLGYQYI